MRNSFEREFSQAIKRRLLEEVRARANSNSNTINNTNNVYGNGKQGEAGGGLQDRFGTEDDPFNYKVKIGRREVKDDQGNVIGWDKDVHRFREPKHGKKN